MEQQRDGASFACNDAIEHDGQGVCRLGVLAYAQDARRRGVAGAIANKEPEVVEAVAGRKQRRNVEPGGPGAGGDEGEGEGSRVGFVCGDAEADRGDARRVVDLDIDGQGALGGQHFGRWPLAEAGQGPDRRRDGVVDDRRGEQRRCEHETAGGARFELREDAETTLGVGGKCLAGRCGVGCEGLALVEGGEGTIRCGQGAGHRRQFHACDPAEGEYREGSFARRRIEVPVCAIELREQHGRDGVERQGLVAGKCAREAFGARGAELNVSPIVRGERRQRRGHGIGADAQASKRKRAPIGLHRRAHLFLSGFAAHSHTSKQGDRALGAAPLAELDHAVDAARATGHGLELEDDISDVNRVAGKQGEGHDGGRNEAGGNPADSQADLPRLDVGGDEGDAISIHGQRGPERVPCVVGAGAPGRVCQGDDHGCRLGGKVGGIGCAGVVEDDHPSQGRGGLGGGGSAWVEGIRGQNDLAGCEAGNEGGGHKTQGVGHPVSLQHSGFPALACSQLVLTLLREGLNSAPQRLRIYTLLEFRRDVALPLLGRSRGMTSSTKRSTADASRTTTSLTALRARRPGRAGRAGSPGVKASW